MPAVAGAVPVARGVAPIFRQHPGNVLGLNLGYGLPVKPPVLSQYALKASALIATFPAKKRFQVPSEMPAASTPR